VPFSCFAFPNSFSAVPRVSGTVIMFCAPGSFSVLPWSSDPVFSSSARPDSFSTVPRASNPVFKFFVPGDVFGGTEGVGSLFHVLRSWTRFRRYRGRRDPFSHFVCPDSFSAVPSASNPFFMFCAPGLVCSDTEDVGSLFHVLRSRTRFQPYRGRPVPFSSFLLPDMFSVEPRASGPVFMFSVPGLVLIGTVGVDTRFHVLRCRTHFRRYRGRPFPFTCFPLSEMFSAISSASGPVFIFSAPGHVSGGTEGVESHFHVLCSRTRFRRY
jgi:hypothetical protein